MALQFIPEDDETPAPTEKKSSGHLTFIPEDDTSATPPSSNPLEYAKAFGEGIAKGIPSGQYLEAKAMNAVGVPEAQTAAEQDRLGKEYPYTTLAGELVGGVATAILMPAAKTASLIGRAAVAAGQAALLQPAYKLGETAHEAQRQTTPLRVEQVLHSLIPDWDTFKAAGIAALFHIPGLAMAGAKTVAGKVAETSAESLFPKAAAVGVKDVGRLALDKDVLSRVGRIGELQRETTRTIEKIAKATPTDERLFERMAEHLDGFARENSSNQALTGAVRTLQKQAGLFLRQKPSGEQIEQIIEGLRAKGTGKSQANALYRDVASTLRQEWGAHIETLNPEFGLQYRNATDDLITYGKIASEADRGAALQATAGDVVKAAAKPAVASAVGGIVGGLLGNPGIGLGAGAAAGGMLASKGNRNYAVLMNNFAKSPPLANSQRKLGQIISHLVDGVPAVAANLSTDVDDTYDQMVKMSQMAMTDPEKFATSVRERVDFLPAVEADAVTSHVITRAQDSATHIPNNGTPPTAFGVQTSPTNRQKREFIDRVKAKFDPYAAVLSGRADLIAEADKHNPETMQLIRKQILNAISTKPNLPYSTKRRLSAILGVAGVPSQDPTLGAMLQQVIQEKRQANDQAGQMDSARQAHAAMKNNKATLSRAQKLLELGEK